MSLTGWLKQLFISPGFGCLRSGHQHDLVVVRALLFVHRWSPSYCIPTRQKEWWLLSSHYKGTNLIIGYTLMTSFNPSYLPKTRLQILSHWKLGLQHMYLGWYRHLTYCTGLYTCCSPCLEYSFFHIRISFSPTAFSLSFRYHLFPSQWGLPRSPHLKFPSITL